MKKIFVFDMDGTFLNDEGTFNTEILSVIEVMRLKGDIFGIATGRPLFAVKSVFDSVFEHFDFLITNNGCEYYHSNALNEYSISALTPDLINKVTGIIRSHKANLVSTTNSGFVADFETEYTGQLKVIGKVQLGVELFDPKIKHAKLMVQGDPEFLEHMAIEFDSLNSEISYMKSQSDLLEIVPYGINKGGALKTYISNNSLHNYHLYCFGDNYNDIELIEMADTAVVVDNAVTPLKDLADIIIETNNEDAILKFLKTFSINMPFEKETQ